MHTNIQNRMITLLVVLAAALLPACNKSAEEVLTLLSETEAAEIVENSVSQRSAGAAMPTVDMAQLLEDYLQNCGVPGDTTLQRGKTAGPVTYTYSCGLDWLVNCNQFNIPQDATVSTTGNGSFQTARWTGTDTASGSLTFTGLNPQAAAYIANGSYTLDGNVTGNLRKTDPTLDVNTTITLTDLTIRKSDYQITGGTGAVVIVATNGRGRTETVNGALTFNSDGTVTVVVNGHTHTF